MIWSLTIIYRVNINIWLIVFTDEVFILTDIELIYDLSVNIDIVLVSFNGVHF